LIANCTFEPPVSTPISRSTAIDASRMIWYSLSVSVCAGATVIESPVCTPIGSTFSIEQTMMQLSLRSRTTSISNSFQPSSDSSIRSSCVGLNMSPRLHISTNSSLLYAMPPPVPPSVNDGRITAGKPMSACTSSACSRSCAIPERAEPRPIRVIAALNFSRSSALSMAFFDAPISSTSNLVNTPSRARSSAQLSAVWPPIVGRSASGRSRSMIFAIICQVIGSTYVTAAISGSVMIVAGLELTRMIRYPSSARALHA
jgi:hypothetical protein